jgi:hypothetical protein
MRHSVTGARGDVTALKRMLSLIGRHRDADFRHWMRGVVLDVARRHGILRQVREPGKTRARRAPNRSSKGD